MSEEIYIQIGHIAKPHGLAGAVKVAGPWAFEGAFGAQQPLFLIPDSTDDPIPVRMEEGKLAASPEGRRVTLESISRMGKFLILSFEEIVERDGAEALRGRAVYGPSSALEKAPSDSYHPHDLIGMAVHTPDGRLLGELEAVLKTGANDIYQVAGANGVEYLLPAVEAFRKEVDLAGRKMVFDPPEGLLEIYESEGK